MLFLGSILQAAAAYVSWVVVWQLIIAGNMTLIPALPWFVFAGLAFCGWLTRFISQKGQATDTPLTTESSAVAFAVLAVPLCILAFALQAAITGLPSVPPFAAPANVPPMFGAAFSILGPAFAGVVEEVAFRGIIQREATPRVGPLRAIGITAFLFLAWHFWNPVFVYQWAGYLTLSLVLGFLWVVSRSLVLCVLAHAAVNLLMNTYVFMAGSTPIHYSRTWQAVSGGALLVTLAAVVFVGRGLWSRTVPK